MNDDVAQIDQHPFTSFFALGAVDIAPGLLDLIVKILGERTCLTVGCAADNHHTVKHAGHGLGVKDLDVLAFDIF